MLLSAGALIPFFVYSVVLPDTDVAHSAAFRVQLIMFGSPEAVEATIWILSGAFVVGGLVTVGSLVALRTIYIYRPLVLIATAAASAWYAMSIWGALLGVVDWQPTLSITLLYVWFFFNGCVASALFLKDPLWRGIDVAS
jgi:hypothetical protein